MTKAIPNYNAQTQTYGGQLTFPAAGGYPQVTIPLYIKQSDLPIRQPKITEIHTVPTIDEAGWSDGVVQAAFFGATAPLSTQISGYILTPYTQVTDAITGLKYQQMSPTSNGLVGGPSLGLVGFSYGDLIWAYIEGKINQRNSYYMRVDPSSYTDPFGNQYNSVVIQTFTCTQTVANYMQNFTLQMFLEV